MTKKKPKDRFQTLSKRQKEVLQLVCQHNSYQRIADKLVISTSTVKAHMHDIYIKLDLDYLNRDERIMQIHDVYCPFFLEDEQPKKPEKRKKRAKKPSFPEPEWTEESQKSEEESQEIQKNSIELKQPPKDKETETEEIFQEEKIDSDEQIIELELEPKPLSPEEEEIIDGDEMALVAYKPKSITTKGKKKVKKPKKKRGCAKFIFTLILGGLMVIGAWYTWNNYVKDIPIVQSIIQLINPDVVIESSPSAPSSSLPSSTSSSDSSSSDSSSSTSSSSDSESIIEKILPKTDENADAYEIGEWHKEDDMWIRLRDYELTSYDYDKIYLFVEIWNKSDNEIHFSWSTESNLVLKDNLGTSYKLTNSYIPGSDNETILPQERSDLIPSIAKATAQYFASPMFESGVSELLFTVEYLSRFEKVTWRIPVNK